MNVEKLILYLSLSAPEEPSREWLSLRMDQARRLFPDVVDHSTQAQRDSFYAANMACTKAVWAHRGVILLTLAQTKEFIARWRQEHPTQFMRRKRWIAEQKPHAWPIHWARERYAELQDQGL